MLFKCGEKIKELIPSAELVPIEGADHDFVVAKTHYDTVQKNVLKFLKVDAKL